MYSQTFNRIDIDNQRLAITGQHKQYELTLMLHVKAFSI